MKIRPQLETYRDLIQGIVGGYIRGSVLTDENGMVTKVNWITDPPVEIELGPNPLAGSENTGA